MRQRRCARRAAGAEPRRRCGRLPADEQRLRDPSPATSGAPSIGGGPIRRRAHTTARDIERYAGLFAKRTRVMRSSAMRDLMEITARPEVISLAGGLPDTSTFPPESFAAQMTRIAQESSAEALQYGPTEGFARTKEVIARGDGGRGDAPGARGRARHHRRPAGARPDRQGADRPRRRGRRRGPDLPRRRAGLLLVRGRDASRCRSTSDGHADRRARRDPRRARPPRAAGRSSSTRCRPSRTRAA